MSGRSTGQHRTGVLNLVDLAGSERVSESGVTGERLKVSVRGMGCGVGAPGC